MNSDQDKNKHPNPKSRPDVRGSLVHKVSSDPFLDWVIILVLATFVALALVLMGISVYLGIGERLGKDVSGANTGTLPLDEKLLNEVVAKFEQLSSERKALEASYAPPKDPSLP